MFELVFENDGKSTFIQVLLRIRVGMSLRFAHGMMHLCSSECTMKYVFGVLVVLLSVEVEHSEARYVLPYVPEVLHPPVPDESKLVSFSFHFIFYIKSTSLYLILSSHLSPVLFLCSHVMFVPVQNQNNLK